MSTNDIMENKGFGEEAYQLRAFAVLPEKLNWVPRTQLDPFTTDLGFPSVYCEYHCLMKV